jgi:hypothetical protein
MAVMADMTERERALFESQMAKVRKNATTGVMLAVLLGGTSAHRFYLGETGVLSSKPSPCQAECAAITTRKRSKPHQLSKC